MRVQDSFLTQLARSGCGDLKVALEAIEEAHSMDSVAADPAIGDALNRDRIEVVPALASFAADDDEFSFFQNAKVLHHGASIQSRESGAKISRSAGTLFEQVEQRTAVWIGKSFENEVVVFFS